MRIIDSFIEVYNQYLLLKRDRYDDVETIQKMDLDPKGVSTCDYLKKGFIYPNKYQYSGFTFDFDAAVPSGYTPIGSLIDYDLVYVLDLRKECVVLWDVESGSVEWECAKKLDDFFAAMIIVMTVQAEMVNQDTFELDQEYLKEQADHCIEITGVLNGNVAFFEHILGIE